MEEALARLLAGSGYAARPAGGTAWRIARRPQASTGPTPRSSSIALQEAPPEPIIVTATKQPLTLLTLPAAVSVLAMAEIGGGQAGDGSAAIASRLEGLSLTSLGPGRNRMFLRGIADSAFSGESQSTVAVVLDDARLTYAAPDPDIRLVDMERVEVLKGPQGSLYGTGALGGIYRMVSRRADLDDSSLSISGSATPVTGGETGQWASAAANLPLASGTSAVRLVGYFGNEPGWIDTGPRRDSNASHVSGARGQLALVPADDWRLDLTGLGQWLTLHDSRYVYAPRRNDRPAQLAEPHDNDLVHGAARLSGQLGGIDVLVASALTLHHVNDWQDATIGAEGLGIPDPRLLIDRRRFRTTDSEFRLRGYWGDVGWLAGVAMLDASQKLVTTLSGATDGMTLDYDLRDSHDAAAYVDITVPLGDTLSFDGGGRLFRASIRETRVLASGPVTRKQAKSGMTPSLALAWQPRQHRLVYLRYGSAFRQGGSDIAANGTVENLAGDELASIEAGWRERLPGGGSLELSAWYSRWENLQSDVLEPNGLIETTNAGNAQITGIEGNLAMPLARTWRMEAGVNVTKARLTRSALGFELEDSRLPIVPAFTLRAALRRDFAIGSADAWARLSLRSVGPSRMSFDPAIDRKMDGRLESEIELHVTRDRWQFELSVQNLLGDKSNVFAFGNALRYRTMRQYSPQRPRALHLAVTLDL